MRDEHAGEAGAALLIFRGIESTEAEFTLRCLERLDA
jgi:hypothetical protein